MHTGQPGFLFPSVPGELGQPGPVIVGKDVAGAAALVAGDGETGGLYLVDAHLGGGLLDRAAAEKLCALARVASEGRPVGVTDREAGVSSLCRVSGAWKEAVWAALS